MEKLQIRQTEQQRKSKLETEHSKSMFGFGRSDRVRTCGIDVPNVARYQLRHTPKCEKYSIFRSISVSGQTCGQTTFIENFAREQSAEKVSIYKGFQRFGKLTAGKCLPAPKPLSLRNSAHPAAQILNHSRPKTTVHFLSLNIITDFP